MPTKALSVKKTWPISRTVEIGTNMGAKSMITAIEKSGIYIHEWARDILGKITFAKAKKTLNLAIVTVAELGFLQGATTKEIFDAARKQGLSLCPPEVGPQLRLQYKDQPIGTMYFIAMNFVADSNGAPLLFYLYHGLPGFEGGLRLNTFFGAPEDKWFARHSFVFVCHK